MNKLGFYIENTTVKYLRDSIQSIKPPVILIHAQDRGLLRDIRRGMSPNSLVIGRLFKDLSQQEAWLDSSDPEKHGREYAEEILRYDFEMAKEVGDNGRLLIDGWMSLNESLRGPASFPGYQVDDQFKRRAEAYDLFQEGFRARLEGEGVAAVAFNFAAGNFTKPDHYLKWFPRTLESYTYLGFHEYGWPSLIPEPGVDTAALYYRTCMNGIRQAYGDRHKVIITELGLTMAYGDGSRPDEGWLNLTQTLSENQYWKSLQWYNNETLKDDYVMGGCLFQVGHSGKRWQSFRHLGEDNQGNAIQLMSRIKGLGASYEPPVPEFPPPTDPPVEPETPSPPVDASLTERVDALIVALDSAIADVGALPAQLQIVENLLSGLTTQADLTHEADHLAKNLDTRLSQVQSSLESMANGSNAAAVQRLLARSAALKGELASLEASVQNNMSAAIKVDEIEQAIPGQRNKVQNSAVLLAELKRLKEQALNLRADIPSAPTNAPPSIQDLRSQLPTHPTRSYPNRGLGSIRRIVVHHTVTSTTSTPEVIARAQVERRDMPGITYHYMVDGEGTAYWVQSLEKVVDQTLDAQVNAEAIAVSLIGNFTSESPKDRQLNVVADLIAWLLAEFGLRIEHIVGRSELEAVSSPGKQWLSGTRYKDSLVAKVNARLSN